MVNNKHPSKNDGGSTQPSKLDTLIHHVFLPLQLPGAYLPGMEESEFDLLRLTTAALLNFSSDPPKDFVINTQNTFRAWESVQSSSHLDPENISNLIRGLGPGESFALYIRRQNAGVLITIVNGKSQGSAGSSESQGNGDGFSPEGAVQPEDKPQAVISTFPASQKSEAVTSSESDLAVVFPSTSVIVPISKVLYSKGFARQLGDLNLHANLDAMATTVKATKEIPEVRDVPDPMYLSKWLTGVLTDSDSRSSFCKDLPRIIKKVRDNVIFKDALIPWRRSGLWMTIKVVLQLCLIKELGKTHGMYMYKMIILKIMLELITRYGREKVEDESSASFDPMMEMLGKVSRRCSKLYSSYYEPSTTKTDSGEEETSGHYTVFLRASAERILNHAKVVLDKARSRLDKSWDKLVQCNTTQLEEWPKSQFLETTHSLTKSQLMDHLTASEKSFQSLMSKVVPVPPTPPRYPFSKISPIDKFDLSKLDSTEDPEDIGTLLYDFEIYVREWDITLITRADYAYVWEAFIFYTEKARSFYSGDPVGFSRMILTGLKIIRFWDEVATVEFPLLLRYPPGVDFSFVPNLVLPGREDMELLYDLEEYFGKRIFEAESDLPPLIQETEVNENSFAVKFSRNWPLLQDTKRDILQLALHKSEAKRKEVQEKRKYSEKLQAQIRGMECKFVVKDWRRRHDNSCAKCRLTRDYDGMRVGVYERPLPISAAGQDAVLFELFIPPSIATLRDILYIFAFSMIGSLKDDPNKTLYGPWVDYFQVQEHRCRTSLSRTKVELMSTKKLFVQCHYRDLHPTNPDDDFIVSNGYNTYYGGNRRLMIPACPRSKVKNDCTLRVIKKSPYSNLQWATDGGVVSPNEVLARQSECHKDLSLREFVEFGTLRSGLLIQWRNVFRAITTNSLSLKTESVFNLLCQCFWEVGPESRKSGPYRAIRLAHEDFADPGFTGEFINLMDELVDRHSQNWQDHYVLLTVINFALRVTSLTQDEGTQEKALTLLEKCRRVSSNWSSEVQNLLSGMTDSSKAEFDAFHLKMIEISICSALTFGLSPTLVPRLLEGPVIQEWLRSIAQIHDHLILAQRGKSLLGLREYGGLRNLLRRVRETGVILERFLHFAFENLSCEGLNLFVKAHYIGWKELDLEDERRISWSAYPSNLHVYHTKLRPKDKEKVGASSTIMQMDILKGGFLVDGMPVAYLHASIQSHPDFQRTFPNKGFVVQPYPYQPGRMSTRDMYSGSSYSFYLKKNEFLVITEHRQVSDGTETWELISHEFLRGNVPHLLVENYTHWWSRKKKSIEFYARDSETPSKLTLTYPDYILNLDPKHPYLKFKTLSTAKRPYRDLVDINTPMFYRIGRMLERLEKQKFIHVFYEGRHDRNAIGLVELPRLGLHFFIHRGRNMLTLISKEYRGKRVAENQTLQTLVGLKRGLILENADPRSSEKERIILVPYGRVTVVRHNEIEITDIGRSPPFFTFEVDDTLKQLKAGESQLGWVYLAYLHAVTASPLIDPFTGLTGTERALQILQSGHAFSCRPLDPETLNVLRELAKLSPRRKYYPECLRHMETVFWPIGLSTQVASDAFVLIVDKLINDSRRLHFLFQFDGNEYGQAREACGRGAMDEVESSISTERDLNRKAYWRRLMISTEQGRISSDFLPELDKDSAPPLTPTSSFDSHFSDDSTKAVLALSQLAHNWTFRPPTLSTNLIRTLLLNGPDLKGKGVTAPFPHKEAVSSWYTIDFRDHWIDLYNLARRVEKKGLKSDWLLILSFFAFRKNAPVPMDQLYFLHTIACNPENFIDLDPPEYSEYFSTLETDLDETQLLEVLRSFTLPKERFLDFHAVEKREYEEVEEFVERMTPVYEVQVSEQIALLADVFKKSWPTDSPDGAVNEIVTQGIPTDWIEIEKVCEYLQVLLKNWFRNNELLTFLSKVEAQVLQTKVNNNSSGVIKEISKGLLMTQSAGTRNEFVSKSMITIDLAQILQSRDLTLIDPQQARRAVELFHRESGSLSQPTKDSLSNHVQERDDKSHPPKSIFPFQSDSDCPILSEYMRDLENSWKESQRKGYRRKGEIPYMFGQLADGLKKAKTNSVEHWQKLRSALLPPADSSNPANLVQNLLITGNIYPRITPMALFRLILQREDSPYSTYIRNLIGAYGILLSLQQQAARCLRYAKNKKDFQEVELQAELANPGYSNWNPVSKPEWLLFQLEMDLMIRGVQATVAERMLHPENSKNALLQLNMGEGKTAVIVPLLVLSVANGSELCRVTVLKSLYEINQRALIYHLGGHLLNRRVYTFPCRRDYWIGAPEAAEMLEVYQECLQKRGVVMSLPEYRLSFQLKAYEKCRAEAFEDGRKLMGLHTWLVNNVRDILDESDEILHVKYQLIYTLGNQEPLGGQSLRWTILQKLLRRVPHVIQILKYRHGENTVEIEPKKPQEFPNCRILKADVDVNKEFASLLAEDIFNGGSRVQLPEVSQEHQDILTLFLAQENIEKYFFADVMRLFPLQVHRETLWILRGLIACGVLCSCLSKRWRVNYGVNPLGHRRVAVPFRAKDVAAERTEFGHPDVAIVLTQLSYYYSGLSDAQLENSFARLFLQPDKEQEYERWMSLIQPGSVPGYSSIRFLGGVNLKDLQQKNKVLFPALRKNMAVIDFWLSTVVFPAESKQFEWKIGCSPWDLCPENPDRPTTGFSGTNDSKLLLPKSIAQKDLPELQGTNGEVLANLLLPQNNNYEALERGITGRGILKKMVEDNINVLLDVGALMLELDNRQVAKVWLEKQQYVDAAVYFDEYNKLVVMDRSGNPPISLEISTFRTRLDRTVIYLDDCHTRGTDLKIPTGAKAVVTLGKGVTKDKLVQGCMRMRKLGRGHRVCFWSSQEVHHSILSLLHKSDEKPVAVGTKEVLEWTIENNRIALMDGFIHWAAAGVYEAQKQSATIIYKASKRLDPDLKVLAESCSQKEVLDLKVMYGEVRILKKFPVIVQHLLKRTKRELEKRLHRAGRSTKLDVEAIVESFGEVVLGHAKKYVADLTRSSHFMDEEQERELEHELEAEYQKYVPPKAKAYEHYLDRRVKEFVESGRMNEIENWGVKLPLTLRSTGLWSHSQGDTWGRHVYGSLDFVRVLKSDKNNRTDDYLRPPHWIVSVVPPENGVIGGENLRGGEGNKFILLLISPFEADKLLPSFRNRKTLGRLHMFAPRMASEQSTLYQNPKLSLPALTVGPSSVNGMTMGLPVTPSMNSALLLFSGSCYFLNREEEEAYCAFNGFCPRPRTEAQEKVLKAGGIVSGFVLPEHRNKLPMYQNTAFQNNPEALVRGIIMARFQTLPIDSHVGNIVLQNSKTFHN